MPTKRTAQRKPDAPISGVAAGSLGTAANLDDTQVMRTEELLAAAPKSVDPVEAAASVTEPPPGRLPLAAPPDRIPLAAPPARAVEVTPARSVVQFAPRWQRPRNTPALAGIVAVVVLLLIA